jgi:D-alanyl-D-alanine dipeptidase
MTVLALLIALLSGFPASAEEMPEGFVYLRDIDPTILQDMRYAGERNFTGDSVPGYDAPECVLVREAAEALKAVQSDLRQSGFSLKVYDCYRPARAVKAFVAWATKPDDPRTKAFYYPNIRKDDLFPDYIARVSGHSRGATVDLTIVPADASESASREDAKPLPCTAPAAERGTDVRIDMGTAFDCFDRKANTFAPGLSGEQERNRRLLLHAMQRRGFQNYEKEWWHYTLRNEPFPETIFNFPILPRPGRAPDANDEPPH